MQARLPGHRSIKEFLWEQAIRPGLLPHNLTRIFQLGVSVLRKDEVWQPVETTQKTACASKLDSMKIKPQEVRLPKESWGIKGTSQCELEEDSGTWTKHLGEQTKVGCFWRIKSTEQFRNYHREQGNMDSPLEGSTNKSAEHKPLPLAKLLLLEGQKGVARSPK